MISTDRIIRERLCLVCARDGVAKPVSEHTFSHDHAIAHRLAMNGWYVQPATRNTEYYKWEKFVDISFSLRREGWWSGVDCGRDETMSVIWLWMTAQELGLITEEAVQRAYMEKLWDNAAKGANHES